MKEERIRSLLPIGSVVKVRNLDNLMMIYGVLQKDIASGKICDYISVIWPIGNGGAGTQFMFNHEDVEKVLFKGLNSLERDRFIGNLIEANKAGQFEC